jgi:hypothetical protein
VAQPSITITALVLHFLHKEAFSGNVLGSSSAAKLEESTWRASNSVFFFQPKSF